MSQLTNNFETFSVWASNNPRPSPPPPHWELFQTGKQWVGVIAVLQKKQTTFYLGEKM